MHEFVGSMSTGAQRLICLLVILFYSRFHEGQSLFDSFVRFVLGVKFLHFAQFTILNSQSRNMIES